MQLKMLRPQAPLQFSGGSTEEEGDEPVAEYVIPFDRNPLSAPGERIIFGARYTDPNPDNYELHYTGEGGEFDSRGSGTTTKTYPGINQRNINFYIASDWDGESPVTVTLQLKQVSDATVVDTTTWNFSKKEYYPTTIEQSEGEEEFDNPAIYTYTVGPDRNEDGNDDYIGQTILERFGTRRSNVRLEDLGFLYVLRHGLNSDQDVTDHFFGTSSSNGTFTVSEGDQFHDRHGGMRGADTAFNELVEPKEIHVELPQKYEAEPGTTLGSFIVRRIRKEDGTRKIKKWRNDD